MENNHRIMNCDRIINKEAQDFYNELNQLEMIEKGQDVIKERIIEVANWKLAMHSILLNAEQFKIVWNKTKEKELNNLLNKYGLKC